MPKGAKPLSVINQKNTVVLYAVVNTGEFEWDDFEVVVQPTGYSFDDINSFQFLGTVALYEATEVYHVFYRPVKEVQQCLHGAACIKVSAM